MGTILSFESAARQRRKQTREALLLPHEKNQMHGFQREFERVLRHYNITGPLPEIKYLYHKSKEAVCCEISGPGRYLILKVTKTKESDETFYSAKVMAHDSPGYQHLDMEIKSKKFDKIVEWVLGNGSQHGALDILCFNRINARNQRDYPSI